MQLKLSHKLLMAGVTDARLLELITWVAQNDAPAKPSSTMVQVAVQSAIDRAVQGGANSSSQTPVVELKVQLQHLLAAGVPIDPTTDTTAPRPVPLLGTIARAYVTSVRVGKISLLHSLFLLLIELGAENLGSISTMVQYWSLLLDEAKVAANNGDQLASTDVPNALDVFAKTNRRLAWEMSLDQLLVASDPTQSILQIADMGLYKISTGSMQLRGTHRRWRVPAAQCHWKKLRWSYFCRQRGVGRVLQVSARATGVDAQPSCSPATRFCHLLSVVHRWDSSDFLAVRNVQIFACGVYAQGRIDGPGACPGPLRGECSATRRAGPVGPG